MTSQTINLEKTIIKIINLSEFDSDSVQFTPSHHHYFINNCKLIFGIHKSFFDVKFPKNHDGGLTLHQSAYFV